MISKQSVKKNIYSQAFSESVAQEENARLKRLLADTMLDNAGLKDLLSKKW